MSGKQVMMQNQYSTPVLSLQQHYAFNPYVQNDRGLQQQYSDNVLLTTSDTFNEQTMDDLHMLLRARHHLKHGSSLEEAVNRTYQDVVVSPEKLSRNGYRGLAQRPSRRVVEKIGWDDVGSTLLKGLTWLWGECTDDLSKCVETGGKVVKTVMCVKKNGVGAAFAVATKNADCPADSKEVPVGEMKTCYMFEDDTTSKIFYSLSSNGDNGNFNTPDKWKPPVTCGCYEDGDNNTSYDHKTEEWLKPSVCKNNDAKIVNSIPVKKPVQPTTKPVQPIAAPRPTAAPRTTTAPIAAPRTAKTGAVTCYTGLDVVDGEKTNYYYTAKSKLDDYYSFEMPNKWTSPHGPVTCECFESSLDDQHLTPGLDTNWVDGKCP